MPKSRLKSKPQYPGVPSRFHEPEELKLFASAIINGGMDSNSDPADIENNKLTLALNARCRISTTYRRAGNRILSPAAPDLNSIIAFNSYKDPSGQATLFRFTPSSIYRMGLASWTKITGAALTMTVNTHIQWVIAGTFIGFGNGIDPLKQINLGADTYATAGNAPAYKYFCTINGRVVGFNLYDAGSPDPIKLGWSGYFNVTEWDNTVDPSAGNLELITSPSGFSDFGTGIFAFGDSILAVRERSLWLGTVQPSASDPFYFYNKVPTMGCDTPKSIQQIPGGIVYFDRGLKNVFVFTLDMPQPIAIGDEVRDTLRAMITNPNLVFSTYDRANDEYHLCIPIGSSTLVRRWVFNFKSKAWTYDTIDNLTALSTINVEGTSVTIDDLAGSIDGLIGTIDGLAIESEISALFSGFSTGVIELEDVNSDIDSVTGPLYSGVYSYNGSIKYGADLVLNGFSLDIRSKLFQLDVNASYVAQLQVAYRPLVSGSFTVWYSKDAGVTFTAYKTVSFGSSEVGKRLKLTCMKNVRGDNYMWRITESTGSCEIIEYKAYTFVTAGYQKQKTA